MVATWFALSNRQDNFNLTGSNNMYVKQIWVRDERAPVCTRKCMCVRVHVCACDIARSWVAERKCLGMCTQSLIEGLDSTAPYPRIEPIANVSREVSVRAGDK